MQANEDSLIQPELSLLLPHLGFIVKVRARSVYSRLLSIYLEDRQRIRVLKAVRGQQLR